MIGEVGEPDKKAAFGRELEVDVVDGVNDRVGQCHVRMCIHHHITLSMGILGRHQYSWPVALHVCRQRDTSRVLMYVLFHKM